MLVAAWSDTGGTVDLTSQSPQLTSNESIEGEWPFDSPRALAVLTLDRIMDGTSPILHVTHDEDDGSWQFLDGGEAAVANAMLVSLRQIANHDPTIKELADLPLGWQAVRGAVGKPWQRSPNKQ